MLTRDFSGVYDYERSEARQAAEMFLEYSAEYDQEQNRRAADRERAHWARVLCHQGLRDFCDEWNKLVPNYPLEMPPEVKP